MPTRELAFERMGLAIEATRGTAITNPTHYLPVSGTLDPEFEVYIPSESRGVLNDAPRHKIIKKWSTWSADAFGLDVNYAPFLFNGALAPVSAPTTPGGATTARLWTFTRVMSADTLKTYTIWWDEPNIGADRAPFGMIDSWRVTSDGTGNEAATMEVSGFAQDASAVSTPTFPAIALGSMVTPMDMQGWCDTTSAIGTTALTNSLLAFDVGVSGGRSQKFYPAGPASSRTYSAVGVKKNRPTGSATFEYSPALAATLRGDSLIKLRVRMNGALIEAALYEYVEFDVWAIPTGIDYGDWADGTNRTIVLTFDGAYDATAGTDLVARVQNAKTTL